mmetsp:Transcript_5359/g.21666  ORF Transcript_5359/g.21666 Transcript_5359/m.21666 type:complete len:213 (+) Transcript_5359:1037-1675(+)
MHGARVGHRGRRRRNAQGDAPRGALVFVSDPVTIDPRDELQVHERGLVERRRAVVLEVRRDALRIVRAAQRERRRSERRVFFPPSRAGGPGGVFRGHDVRGAHEPSHAHALGCVDGQRRAARRRPRRRRRQIARERVAEILLGDDDAAGALGERRQTRRARRFAAAAKDIHGDAEGSHLCTRERRWLMVSFSCVVSVRFSVNGKCVGVNVRA